MIWNQLKEKFDSLSRAQRQVARYMLDNQSESLFMTAQQIAVKSNASEATVFRLAVRLGFPGFPEFKEALQAEAKNQLSTFSRLEEYQGTSHRGINASLAPVGRLEEHHTHEDEENYIYSGILGEIKKASPELRAIESERAKNLAKAICAADAIYLIGLRSARGLAIYMQYYLTWFFPHVHTPENDFFENYLASAPKNSLVIGISFPRYTRLTLECVLAAKNAGLRTAAITDAGTSPLTGVADMSVLAPCVHIAHIDSLLIPLGAANAILIEVAELLGPKALNRLAELEKIWEKNKVYC